MELISLASEKFTYFIVILYFNIMILNFKKKNEKFY